MSDRRESEKSSSSLSQPSRSSLESIPLADDESVEEINQDEITKLNLANLNEPEKLQALKKRVQEQQKPSLPPQVTNASFDEIHLDQNHSQQQSLSLESNSIELSEEEREEKERMIQQVLELQNTLDDLSFRVESVKEENLKLKSENQVLGQYIENLVKASMVFQSTSPKVQKNASMRT
ncbi:Short coiled-coil protein [Sarcoptes scabiei]|uniref:Short coiled-coil protein n=1 Tax=Sarcoptes scabiei TaxID=52283 RepID=A0A834VFG5_SARSC|nr:Short coiled-coil protein [Sarcoptes scabiei]UXI22047.1 N-acetylgalactosaminyltransferase 7 [Sarcoptes scabiei]